MSDCQGPVDELLETQVAAPSRPNEAATKV